MKYVFGTFKMPLDMAVFLGITLGGFGLSVKELAYPNHVSLDAEMISATTVAKREPQGVNVIPDRFLDLGCLDRRGVHGRMLSDFSNLRIRARFCGFTRQELKQIHSIRLRNLTTGAEEDLPLVGESLVSNLHRLQHGKNVLQLEWREKANPDLKIVRADVFE